VKNQGGKKNLIAAQPSPAKILVIEDNPGDVFLLRQALNKHHEPYVLEILRDGQEAIEFISLQRAGDQEEPCVIVLDLHLPKHSGADVLKALRKEPVLAHLIVVALTTLASPSDEQEVRRLGVRLYRAKPNQLEEWLELAAEILEICREHSRIAA
jgi:CheY-like chemotaxis protein